MSIPVFQPRISVVLKKNVGREFLAGNDDLGGAVPAGARFQGMTREIDLTGYLGEAGSVRTTKSVREPAGGFTLTLADRMHPDQMESLYGLIEPMDLVEIRMAHEPHRSGRGQLPIVMRGFISNVSRVEVMGPDGSPQRAVQVNGQDYGKLWQIIQIKYLANFAMGQELLTFLKFAQNYGVTARDMTPNEFVYEAVQGVLNKFTAAMRASGEDGEEDLLSPVLDIDLFDLTVPDARISPFGVNSFAGGTLYQLLTHYGDVGPWNELFIQDREDGVAVVYRPNPFKRPDGEFVQQVSEPYEPPEDEGGVASGGDMRKVLITDAQIVSNTLGRSDQGVANYYWVDNPAYTLSDSNNLRLLGAADSVDTYYIKDYRNSAPWLYGLRLMEQQTNQGVRIDGRSEADQQESRPDAMSWLKDRRSILVEANRDNAIFEAGSLSIQGNERIRAGDYLGVRRGNLEWEAYVVQVDQLYSPFRSYTTQLTVERGTGFIERAQKGRGKQSPYLAELSTGGVYGGGR